MTQQPQGLFRSCLASVSSTAVAHIQTTCAKCLKKKKTNCFCRGILTPGGGGEGMGDIQYVHTLKTFRHSRLGLCSAVQISGKTMPYFSLRQKQDKKQQANKKTKTATNHMAAAP